MEWMERSTGTEEEGPMVSLARQAGVVVERLCIVTLYYC